MAGQQCACMETKPSKRGMKFCINLNKDVPVFWLQQMLLLEDLVRINICIASINKLPISIYVYINSICNYLILYLFYTFRGTGGKLLCSIRILPEIKRHVTPLDLYLKHANLDAVVFELRMQ